MNQPKIDYALLGRAIDFYRYRGWTYVEVPWFASTAAIEATLPADAPRFIVAVEKGGEQGVVKKTPVGSAEQGLIAMKLPPGCYVACTPCFRVEPVHSVLYQDYFMKVELFDNRGKDVYQNVIDDALAFFREIGVQPAVVQTDIGIDLELDGIEIGSYGIREHPDFGKWSYGTGLALPRFSVANALHNIVQ